MSEAKIKPNDFSPDTFVQEYKLPRDVLVELSIRQLGPVIEKGASRE